MADFWGGDSRLLSHRYSKLSGDQFKIWITTLFCEEARNTKGIGIYRKSTASFELVPQEIVQDELGYTKQEILLAGKPEEVRRGKFCKQFPHVIDYDPENDMVHVKDMFEFCALKLLTHPKAIVEGIHKDFKMFERYSKPEWWGEFMHRYSAVVHKAWSHYKPLIKRKDLSIETPMERTFRKLFEYEQKYEQKLCAPSAIFLTESAEKLSTKKHEISSSSKELTRY